jgi:CheY-like chemotaxis protein
MKHILVIDDEPAIRRLFVRLGSTHGWDVTSVASGQDALAALNSGSFEVAFVDVDQNGTQDGIAVARKLKDLTRDLRVIMMSADPANSALVEAAGLGTMLSKPFKLVEIKMLVDG